MIFPVLKDNIRRKRADQSSFWNNNRVPWRKSKNPLKYKKRCLITPTILKSGVKLTLNEFLAIGVHKATINIIIISLNEIIKFTSITQNCIDISGKVGP